VPDEPPPEVPLDFAREWVEFPDPADPEHVVRADMTWLSSAWTCIFGRGCAGVVEGRPDDGCCSHGAFFTDGDDLARVTDAVALLTDEDWQLAATGRSGWTERDADDDEDGVRAHRTRVVDGACVFLNRPGFAGGAGCALHLAALDAGDSPTEWKPSVCWQLPLRIDWQEIGDDSESATVRRWSRGDWGGQGRTMAWCCTERTDGGEAYSGDTAVVESLRDELIALAGEPVYVELRRRLG